MSRVVGDRDTLRVPFHPQSWRWMQVALARKLLTTSELDFSVLHACLGRNVSGMGTSQTQPDISKTLLVNKLPRVL